jgi:hypothetical protein
MAPLRSFRAKTLEASHNCKSELQSTIHFNGSRAFLLLSRLVATTLNGMDTGQADEAPFYPAPGY